MASTSLSSSTPNHFKYDVFLSFRGEDTRHTFTDHLYDALVRSGLRTFRDDNDIGRGQVLKQEIQTAIVESRAFIVIISANYANSTWCLDELLLILEQRRNINCFVLPVFYHVDPSDVKNHRGSFAIDVVEGRKWTEANVNRWKEALNEVADLTGMVVSGSETGIIAKVVDTIDYELDLKLVSTPAHLTGMETRAEVVNSWLKDEQSSVNVLAICGMGGCGKTTLAKYIYNLNKQNFESSCFLEEIGKHYKQPYGLIRLQEQLLTDLGGKNKMISSVSQGASKIEEVLQLKKALIVLDDIDDKDELGTLLGTKVFHTQSKIIITTRFRDIYAWFGSLSLKCRVQELELFNDDESLELLSWHAFGSKIPMEGFKELAVQLALYCEGNPLALIVLGSSLFVSAEDPLNINNMINIWRSRMNSLNSLKGDLDSKIQCILQKSFDSLPCDSLKELFLHIACFFVGEYQDVVALILEKDLYAQSGIRTLINRCLLTVSPANKLMMHQLLQDMGRKIVCEESKDPAKRSRVWCSDEAYHVLIEGDGSKKIEGLALDIRKLKEGTEPLALKTGSLVKMKNLKLLQLRYVELVGSYKNFPDLRCLCWHGSHLKRIPSGLLMSSLVAIDMSYSYLEKFEPPMVLNSLKILNLEGCDKLVCIRSLYRFPKLECLMLRGCISLTRVCKTIGGLEGLALLDLTGCNKMWNAPSNKKYVNQLEKLKAKFICGGNPEETLLLLPHSIKILHLDYCKLKYNNDVRVVFHAQSFFYLSLESNLFEFLPNTINLNMLRVLKLTSCPNLKSLQCIPSTLEELYTYWCTSLEKITFQSASFRLREFGYEGCLKLSEIQGLFKLVPIAKINKAGLGNMQWIKAYEDQKVDLVGDEITKGRIWHIQMLYEYGIKSTFLPGIKDETITTSEYTSSSPFLSFHVPLCPQQYRIQGLNVTVLYRSSGGDRDRWGLFVQISNRTKGLTWIYNPVVYCKPKVDEDVVWLSYWPIGNILDVGDEVYVEMILEEGLVVSGCGARLEYMDDGEVDQEENMENNGKGEEVIGGDLSEFEVTAGGYYLCRRDLFGSSTSYMLEMLFGNTVQYTELQGWKKSRQSKLFNGPDLKATKGSFRREVELGVSFNSESKIDKIEKVVSSLEGVESVSIQKEIGRLFVTGNVDPVEVANCVKEYEKMVEILQIFS
ncbi:toll/interleukin-1 receptor (TIR) domain-containing protein [Artemisia annua]|uniref:Toll/interleukin-1 receptor (TIR) domain-containing protein n=1 Tax=Artemisia annua TaxID=35608 RepID=A0A2U1MMN6_ARTAN|nr:toll/interleukin-1 receptor (TIR) domain-containing protein [Artemisia annua]